MDQTEVQKFHEEALSVLNVDQYDSDGTILWKGIPLKQMHE